MKNLILSINFILLFNSCSSINNEHHNTSRLASNLSILTDIDPLFETKNNIFQKMRAQELKNDVKCWSTSRHIDEVFSGMRLTGDASHQKEQILKYYLFQLWYFAQNLNPEKKTLGVEDIQSAYKSIRRVDFLTDSSNNQIIAINNSNKFGSTKITITKQDQEDYRKTSNAWRVLYSVANETKYNFLKSNLSDAAIDFLAQLSDLQALLLLKLGSHLSKEKFSSEIDAEILKNVSGKISPSTFNIDGWSHEKDVERRAYAQSLAYAKMKIDNLNSFNGIITNQEILKSESKIAGAIIDQDASIHFHNVLKDITLLIWNKAQKFTTSSQNTKEVLISGNDMFKAVEETLPYTVDEVNNVIFYPQTENAFSYQEFESNSFRDDAPHWKILYHLLENFSIRSSSSEKNRTLLPLDIYAAEEITELVSNYAVPLLKKSAELAKHGKSQKISKQNINDANQYFLNLPKSNVDVKNVSQNTSNNTFNEIHQAFSNITNSSGIKGFKNAYQLNDTLFSSVSLLAFDAFRGLAVGDINNDDLPDLFIAEESEQSKVYINLGNGKFKDITEKTGIKFNKNTISANFIDFDNDGCKDFFALSPYYNFKLYKGNCKGNFKDISEAVGFTGQNYPATGSLWFDYDNDGFLDLYILTTGDFKNGFLPTFGDVENAQPNQFYKNISGKSFENKTIETGLGDRRISLAGAFSDFNGDGKIDLYLANDMQPNSLYENKINHNFENIAKTSNVADFGNGMGVSIGDFNHDQLMDIYLTNISLWNPATRYIRPEPGTQISSSKEKDKHVRVLQANRLFQNMGNFKFKDVSNELIGKVDSGWGWNGFFFDFNNDQYLDIYITNGFRPESLSNHDEKKVLLTWDQKLKRYRDVSAKSGADFRSNSRGSAFFDFNRDGLQDLILTGLHSPALFKNILNPKENNWISIKLIGTKSNKDAFGAKVEVKANQLIQSLEMGNQGGGFVSSINDNLHFGLAKSSMIDYIKVFWPSGAISKLENINPNKMITIIEE